MWMGKKTYFLLIFGNMQSYVYSSIFLQESQTGQRYPSWKRRGERSDHTTKSNRIYIYAASLSHLFMIPSENVSTNKFHIGILTGKFTFSCGDLLYVLSFNRTTVQHFSRHIFYYLAHISLACRVKCKRVSDMKRERERENTTKNVLLLPSSRQSQSSSANFQNTAPWNTAA